MKIEKFIRPDNNQLELRQLLADYTGVDARRIVAANGSNQLIDLIVRLFVSPGDEEDATGAGYGHCPRRRGIDDL